MKILLDIPPGEVASVSAALLSLDPLVEVRSGADDVGSHWADCLLTWAPSALQLQQLSQGGFIQAYGAGVDRILATPELPTDIAISRIIDPRMSLGMTQHVVLAILRWLRREQVYRDQQARREWRRLPNPDAGSWPVGILGFGAMGRELATALGVLGFPVRGWRRRDGLSTDFSEFLSKAQVLVCLTPLTAQTRGMLNHAALSRMPKGSYVVNCGRGPVIVEADLLAALDSGHIEGAALDVFETEPLAASSPIWAHPHIVVTPHIATFPNAAAVAEHIIDNLHRVKRGEAVANIVDVGQGY